MARLTLLGASAAGLLILVGWCFGPAIGGRQFAYRDAAHFYYPLYQRVEAEWDAGRVPLWEPEENAGMPLLGNPTAAVLYPGKLIYRALPYPMAARIYTIAHTILAFIGMVVLARSLGIGGVGSAIAGLSYAFGAPVIFQYCNIIYLVGAAWVPWAIAGVDAWLRRGRRWGLVLLAVGLTMQVLGGDPQAAYLVGLAAGAYAFGLTRSREGRPWSGRAWGLLAVGLVVGLAAWTGITLGLAAYLPTIRGRINGVPQSFVWNRFLPGVVAGCWGVAGLRLIRGWALGRLGASELGRKLGGLAASASLAGLLAGAQLLPVMEFTGQTGRAADEGTHDIYPFSLEPYRVLELAWPNVFGTVHQGNRTWLNLIPPVASHRLWVTSLYVGGVTVVLALAGLAGRDRPGWRPWFAGIAAFSLLGAVGEFGGPLWIARCVPSLAAIFGRHDEPMTNAIRLDGQVRDGDGSFYSIVSTLIPGFQQFRYPSKLLTFTVLGIAALAGHGWDRVLAGRRLAALRWSVVLTGLSVLAIVGLATRGGLLLAWFQSRTGGSIFGPFDPAGAFRDTRNAFVFGGLSFGGAVVATLLSRRHPTAAGAFVVLLLALDLAHANGRLIATVDQAEFDRVPKAVEVIARAEEENPSGGPYRVHRMPIWGPMAWTSTPSDDRTGDFVRWERDTIQPKYGLPYGIHYTFTQGVAELYDYEWFFGPFTTRVGPDAARFLHLDDPASRVVYFPRRGFDLWNTRYFILPGVPKWDDPERGVASFFPETTPIYPGPDAFRGPGADGRRERYYREEDVQIVRNLAAMPRAWVVHDARSNAPIDGLTRDKRRGPMEEMLYKNDEIWNDDARHAFDIRSIAWLELEERERARVARYLPKGTTASTEAVTVRMPSPVRTELEVTLDRPGLVILADAFYPGWTLTDNGRPTPILRANRMMRGAAVEAGPHTLVYEYRPRSFGVGAWLSGLGAVGLLVAGGWSWRGRGGATDELGAVDGRGRPAGEGLPEG